MSPYSSAKRQKRDQAGAQHSHGRLSDRETKSKSQSVPLKRRVSSRSQSQPEPVPGSVSAPPQHKGKSNPPPHRDAGSASSKHKENSRREHLPAFAPLKRKLSKSTSKPKPKPRLDSLATQEKAASKPAPEPGRYPQLEAEPDPLNHLLNTLDDLDRASHLGKLQTNVTAARNLLSAARGSLRTYQSHVARLSGEIRRTRQYAEEVVAGETNFDARADKERGNKGEEFLVTEKYLRRRGRRIARSRANLELGEKLLEEQRRLYAHTEGLYKAVRWWVQALQTLAGLWTRIWDLYESMNQVGPSSRAQSISTQWLDNTQASLWRHLIQVEMEVQTTSREVTEAQTALAKDSLVKWEEDALD
ncbi:hypothetical protein G647_03451 [Cladophialophora carrionii CBS 160.54]|uniref:Uncharacterized protein n=1 Tax=Cladophialophora carrionii CBS 160.54 TaxID=1279043 RepID=V9DDP0_9EURO|nr:uncharacterized protein G647_03451 [Cladophialophora carrionii CBS 160.54]ETI24082.1 hypothetical protein G647_03451 [Cladophialophora carrionii CBS 160.54]